jgi:ribose 5-phosphate isomerase B
MKLFDLITEADARVLEVGSTVRLAPGGIVTPLARDTLRARRVTVERDDGRDVDLEKLAPPAKIGTAVIGADHTGVGLKRTIVDALRREGVAVIDVGTNGTEAVDYPDIAAAVATTVARGEADAGIVIDGAGIGSAMAANKIAGVRAAMCTNETLARYAREHNGANVLTLGATLVAPDEALRIVRTFFSSAIREARYLRRLAKIARLERS